MNNFQKFLRFFCACAPGIAIGFWMAEKAGFFWPIGAIIGAGISYLLVDWKEVVLAVPKAWNKAISWKPDKFAWRCRGLIFLGFLSALSSCALFFVGGMIFCMYLPPDVSSNPPQNIKELGICFLLTAAGVLYSFTYLINELTSINIPFMGVRKYKKFINNSNPLAVFIYWPIKGLVMVVVFVWDRFIPSCIDFGNFLKEVIFTIHSDKRVICATVTFITVVSGYMVDGGLVTFTIVGAIIGGLYSISPWRKWVIEKTQPHQLASA